MMSRSPVVKTLALASVAIMLGAVAAEARPGRGSSSGSRGERTYSAPPATNTAPGAAQPMQRSVTPAPAPAAAQPGMAQRPPQGAPPAAQPNRSPWGALGMGLAAGFLGAGLFGLLSGQGFMAGLGSMMGFLGFLAQILLIGGLIWLAFRLFRGRKADGPTPAYQRAAGGPNANGPTPGPVAYERQARDGTPGAGLRPAAAGPTDTVGIQATDFDMFERRLLEVQDAYSREDLASLRACATPEMVSYFAEELKENAAKGVVNRITDVKLLQGDLAEAWREPVGEFATVAMRYALTDVTVERASGRQIGGNSRSEEVTELWTFMRPPGGAWALSAIQQS